MLQNCLESTSQQQAIKLEREVSEVCKQVRDPLSQYAACCGDLLGVETQRVCSVSSASSRSMAEDSTTYLHTELFASRQASFVELVQTFEGNRVYLG